MILCSDKSSEGNVGRERWFFFKGAGVVVVRKRPAVDLKHFEDKPQAVANESDKHSNIRLYGYTLHCNVPQACRHQPLQGSSSADSDKYKLSFNAPTNFNSSLNTPTIMGQRHQFFAIARINNRYRTLAAVHNQWLYGHSACCATMSQYHAYPERRRESTRNQERAQPCRVKAREFLGDQTKSTWR